MASSEENPTPTSPPSKLKIAGAASGIIEVHLDQWTVAMLRAELSKRSADGRPPECVKMISGGKVLKDGTETLVQLGIKHNSKILVTFVEPNAGAAIAVEERKLKEAEMNEEERTMRLARIRAAAEKMAVRHTDGSMPLEDYNIELEDQSGQKVKIGSENDQRGLMMGLMLHANAKKLMKKKNYRDALDVLAMGEEAFSLCDPKVLEMIDNMPMLLLDTVWCYFMLRDISCLSMAGIRLQNARKGFERAHGNDSTRLRLLQAGRHAEVAIYLRLELLEGVVAYHIGHLERSRNALSSAQAKYLQLQVSDEALSLLMGMGYREKAAKRALRMNGQNMCRAVDFLVEERERKTLRREEDIKRKNEIKEQKIYGMTPQKKPVDIQRLNELVSIGFERRLAAEALRINENDMQKALDDLTNPQINSELQTNIASQKKQQKYRASQEEIDTLVSMGYERSAVLAALRDSASLDGVLNLLVETVSRGSNIWDGNAPSSSNPDLNGNNLPGGNMQMGPEEVFDTAEIEEERDWEMEDEIASELTGDPLADYDIEVTLEGEAIAEYLSLVESGTDVANRSQ